MSGDRRPADNDSEGMTATKRMLTNASASHLADLAVGVCGGEARRQFLLGHIVGVVRIRLSVQRLYLLLAQLRAEGLLHAIRLIRPDEDRHRTNGDK